ncbi:hypothetical protein PPACK8108_LOCUS20556 [Phakopsora pachyrhizi]|uniref:Peptidase A1 domain-containing protein n=1 Tax=Phakopsora pachyrhizi TaxID=170000 RepID=A0AAV0BGP0_PHAPC|nr:hypothetical protein PPACK8108_LOCUS20555 [Phakopsora pachyrhizi]CAH7685965.1 hypothetical protein PPACK8108_LOCUS20556 [Phakopsora pachyrhizi]
MAVSSYQLLMDINNRVAKLSNRASRDAPSKISPVDISSNSNDANCGWVEGVGVIFDVDPEPKSYLSGLQQRTQLPETAQSECSFQTPQYLNAQYFSEISIGTPPNRSRSFWIQVHPTSGFHPPAALLLPAFFTKMIWRSRMSTFAESIKEPVLAFAFGKFDGITNRYLPFTLGTTSSTSADTEGGEAVFGGLDKAHYEGKIYYAPVRRCGYWEVELKSVKFGDKEIKLHKFGAAINTGQ